LVQHGGSLRHERDGVKGENVTLVTFSGEDRRLEDLEGVKSRIVELVEEFSEGVPTRFAALVGMPWPTFRNYYEGSRVPAKKELRKILDVTSVTADWLLEGKEPKRVPHSELHEEGAFADVPLMAARASAGGGLVAEEGVEGLYKFRRDWLASVGPLPSLCLVRVVGDSMGPTLRDGDMVMVDRSRREPNGINLIRTREGVSVKRVRRTDDARVFLVVSDNVAEYPPRVVNAKGEDFDVLGRVVWMARRME
jgi:phage repressor protein C with HTH and peptisase S24 domain